MKKLLIFATALLASATVSAQTVLWDGEDKELGTLGGFWDRGTPSVVENPEKDGINPSNKCLKFTMTGDEFGKKHVACPFRDWISPNLNGNRRISFMIMKAVNENVKVELSDPTNGADNYWEKVAAWYGGDGKWEKVVLDFSTNTGMNDFPGVIAIEAQTGSVTSNQDVYIDNIVIEPVPMVGETALSAVADASLTGAITVSGSMMKGECQNANGDWYKVEYNDFATLKSKLTTGITSINMRGVIMKDFYSFVGETNNAIILTDAGNAGTNVVAGTAGSATCSNLVLDEAYPFATPEDFTATSVELTRKRYAGYNTFVLPFWASATDLGATAVYTHKTGVTFKQDTDEYNPNGFAGANVPFIANFTAESTEKMNFTNKGVCTTPATFDSDFKGVYAPQSAENLYGINGDGKLQKGGNTATIKSFHAYLESVPAGARTITFDDGETTGIDDVRSKMPNVKGEYFNLSGQRVAQPTRGLYIVNGKKVVIK